MPTLIQMRIAKYDPANRDAAGNYLRDEWTSFSDVGASVTLQEYERVESAYVSAALKFLGDSGTSGLRVVELETRGRNEVLLDEGMLLSETELGQAFRLVLREQVWCRFEQPEVAFVHFGWDYYMYVGVPRACPQATAHAERLGLFVEECRSPYCEISD